VLKNKLKPVYLKDYQKPDFLISETKLRFDIAKNATTVTASLQIKRNGKHQRPLVLDGEELKLISIELDKQSLAKQDYKITPTTLTIAKVPNDFSLTTKVKIKPQNNTTLEGLYYVKGTYCTQNEPHGFRKITYYIDRPDVLAKFTTTICADKKLYPIQLSNGNLQSSRDELNLIETTWEDPFPKPSYLFALVVGNLGFIEDKFITKSNRQVTLRIYTKPDIKNHCWHAMRALQAAMRWDEKVFGLEYDLDIYMIVAMGDFNMGGMENKGLNVFNTKYILANPKTATDNDYLNITNVVGHEYFHNWTGDRVTVRDWFQLTLKEGLTVFREQLFAADMTSPAIQRIKDTQLIRTRQFPEDAGPMKHPVQPKSYIEMNNFYTTTTYYKGAEIIRMLYTILGKKLFIKGMGLYIKRNDGQAVTTEDFIAAMEDASKIDLKQFRNWYHVAGTPLLKIKDKYDTNTKTYELTITQNKNFYIPFAMGFLNSQGQDLLPKNFLVHIKNKIHKITFNDFQERPKLSLLRNFSAPIKVQYNYTTEDLAFLFLRDSDPFARWDAGQKLMLDVLLQQINNYQQRKKLIPPTILINTWHKILPNRKIDSGFKTLLLTFPHPEYLMTQLPIINIDAVFHAYEFVKQELAKNLKSSLLECYLLPASTADQRSLKNLCLHYLTYVPDKSTAEICMRQFNTAKDMTDIVGSLRALTDIDCTPKRQIAFEKFYQKWKHEDLLVDKWLELQAISKLPNTLTNIQKLIKNSSFDIKNPNRVYALIKTFTKSNYSCFHDIEGNGYRFLTQQIVILDKINPLVAANLLEPLTNWQKFDKIRKKLMLEQLKYLKKQPKLSPNVYEIVTKSLYSANNRRKIKLN
jgi:aminopeptidase N